ncbi:MAG: NUDIX domain-containing protein [Candidatus Heimdallarchaeota archaeon]|nr:NUDIX domain-containing protein [Candidatus Heimdallarchaeota archaeon]
MTHSEKFLSRVAKEGIIRPCVRSLCFHQRKILVEQPSDEPSACFAFPGGGLELGETLEERLKKEYLEEANVQVISQEYLFLVENRFSFKDTFIHSLEHYFLVQLENYDIESKEPEIILKWLPIDQLPKIDLRPEIVRDVIINGAWRKVKHLVQPFEK